MGGIQVAVTVAERARAEIGGHTSPELEAQGQMQEMGRVRDLRAGITWVTGAYLAVAALGTWVAVRRGLSGRPFGWDLDASPLPGFVYGLGTALSAPLGLLVALVTSNVLLWRGLPVARRAAVTIALLGAGFTLGMLVEPITWDHETWSEPRLSAIVAANLSLPSMLVLLAAWEWAGCASRE